MMYKNYLFDFYGTLADIRTNEDSPVLWRKLAAFYASFSAVYKPAELRRAFREREKEEKTAMTVLHQDVAMYHPEPDLLKVFERLFVDKGTFPSDDLTMAAACFFRIQSRSYLRLYPDTLPLLKTLKERGARVYLLSNAQASFTGPEIRLLGLEDYFDEIYLSSDKGCKKPDSAFFMLPLLEHHLKAEETLMVGNDLYDDISGALAAGLDCAYIHTNLSREVADAPVPTYCIRDLMEVAAL